ncbi:MAG TPA: hypothetical protein VGD08_14820, partial [Stellaceae bacterium]
SGENGGGDEPVWARPGAAETTRHLALTNDPTGFIYGAMHKVSSLRIRFERRRRVGPEGCRMR